MIHLITKSDHLKADADCVIASSHIQQLFGALGTVTFVGSYALNLLYRPDIDMFVQSNDCTREKAVTLTKTLLDTGFFQTVGFADWTHHEAPNKLPGFYWELVYASQSYRWKFDVWFTAVQDIKTIAVTKKIMEQLQKNPDARLQILELKEAYFNGETYREGMNGIRIYEKVLGKIE